MFTAEEEEELRRILERNDNQSMRSFVSSTSASTRPNHPLSHSRTPSSAGELGNESIDKWLEGLNKLDVESRRNAILRQRERLYRDLRLLEAELETLRNEFNDGHNGKEQRVQRVLSQLGDESLTRQSSRSSAMPGVNSKQHSSTTKTSTKMVTIQPQIKPIMEANDDWRAAIAAPAYYNRDFSGNSVSKKPQTHASAVRRPSWEDDMDLDFDYGRPRHYY